jgi:hypothetical protein
MANNKNYNSNYLSIAGIIISVFSLVIAGISILQSKQANQIALQAISPQMSVKYLYPLADYRDYVKEPCKKPSGFGYWGIEYSPVFDITNTGGISNSLTDIHYSLNVETIGNKGISPEINYIFFGSDSNFQKWFETKALSIVSYEIMQSIENITTSGPPITIEPGETKRIVLSGGVEVSIDPLLQLNQVYQFLYGTTWESKINFIFGDGTIRSVSVFVPRPFYGVPGTTEEYQECSDLIP